MGLDLVRLLIKLSRTAKEIDVLLQFLKVKLYPDIRSSSFNNSPHPTLNNLFVLIYFTFNVIIERTYQVFLEGNNKKTVLPTDKRETLVSVSSF